MSSVSDFAPDRDSGWFDEHHGVIADNSLTFRSIFSNSLHTSTPFIGERARPDSRVAAAEEGVQSFEFACDGVQHFTGDSGVVLR